MMISIRRVKREERCGHPRTLYVGSPPLLTDNRLVSHPFLSILSAREAPVIEKGPDSQTLNPRDSTKASRQDQEAQISHTLVRNVGCSTPRAPPKDFFEI